ncbi:hypothetical protein [Bdellovibrio svalbardensis]|uniref:Uncharacterized protein n=1 Tax=Bdellovibrio svalbardensis TaxID=2972972 RepID=A0ABT6DMU7_9BACT|nr:hypothetical protein [Bdellovibrio svalbardensis]MDG0818201.1 hypothetical protein [Bdellovibrio svalbardensis]
MKNILATLLIVLSFNAASAATQEPEFCKKMVSYEGEVDPFFNTVTIDIKKTRTLSPFYLKLVNEYLVGGGYLEKATSLKEIQATLKANEEYNDFYLKIRTSKATGEVHIEVLSYPGDNPVGTIYSPKTGAVIGHNNDDSYSHIVDGKEVYCEWQ